MDAKQLYSRLLTYVRPYWLVFIVSIAAMLIFASTEAGLAALMRPLMDSGFIERDPKIIEMMPMWIIIIFLIRGVANFLTLYGLGWIARNVITKLRSEMFKQLITLPSSYFDQNNSGELMSKLLYDVEQVASAATDAILTVVRDGLTIIALLTWMIYLSSILSLIVLLTAPSISLIIYKISSRFRNISKTIQDSMGDVSHIGTEIITGHREVKTFGGQEYEINRFSRVNQKTRHQRMKILATEAISQPIIQLITVLGLSVIIYLASLPEVLDSITPGSFISFITAMFMILTPLKRLTKVNANLQGGIAAAESIFILLDQTPELDTGEKTLERIKGHIVYKNVSFRYNSHTEKVLDSISFEAKPGQTIAFVGHSGSGKTTLVNLLVRFYTLSSGKIKIDGLYISDITLKNLRKQISLVDQQVVLFNDTIANNISYGKKCPVSDNEIIKVAQAAHAWDFIKQLPNGLSTKIGQNGILLSGGQRQRLAIARSILHDAPILILDEATSSLDTKSESNIHSALKTLMKGRTTLVIAHRLSTIKKADRIIVMHHGKIIEAGTHMELLDKDQKYADLYHSQFYKT